MAYDYLHQYVRLNAIAEYFQIPLLVELSRRRFEAGCSLVHKWDLPGATIEAKETTGDELLHDLATSALAHHMRHFIKDARFPEIFTELGTGILAKYHNIVTDKNCESEKQIEKLQAELAAAKGENAKQDQLVQEILEVGGKASRRKSKRFAKDIRNILVSHGALQDMEYACK
jgi:hypothetical protein